VEKAQRFYLAGGYTPSAFYPPYQYPVACRGVVHFDAAQAGQQIGFAIDQDGFVAIFSYRVMSKCTWSVIST
jgi:hypothetical protein